MQRRPHDPLLPNEPNLVTDPDREAAITAEVTRKFFYLRKSYGLEKVLRLDRLGYNAALKKLRAAVDRPGGSYARKERLHPWLETEANIRARKLGGLEIDAMLQPEHGEFVRLALIDIAETAKPKRGRPSAEILRRHVAGLVAVMQEATGRPVLGPRDRCSVYEPALKGTLGKGLRLAVDDMERGVSDTALAQMVRDIRKEFAGKSMRFQDLFPLYGATPTSTLAGLSLRPPYAIETFAINAPIYSPYRG